MKHCSILILSTYIWEGKQLAKFGFGNIMQGVLGNMSTQTKVDLEQE
jgi:hypothetical protein